MDLLESWVRAELFLEGELFDFSESTTESIVLIASEIPTSVLSHDSTSDLSIDRLWAERRLDNLTGDSDRPREDVLGAFGVMSTLGLLL